MALCQTAQPVVATQQNIRVKLLGGRNVYRVRCFEAKLL